MSMPPPLTDVAIPEVQRFKGPKVPIIDPVIIAVTGGRDYTDMEKVYERMTHYHHRLRFTHVVHGGATGLDSIVDAWCDTKRGVQSVLCRAHWKRDGKGAGPIRNSMMAIIRPTVLLAFPGGTGTRDMVRTCKAYGTRVICIGGKKAAKKKARAV